MKEYKIKITNGKYPKEYRCSLFTHMHVWRFKWWMHVKTQRGPLFFICNMAVKWGKTLNCEVINKTTED